MSKTHRYVLLGLAAVIAIAALVILPGGDDDNEQTATQAARATATTTAPAQPTGSRTTSTAPPEPAARPRPPLLTAGRVRKLEFEKGETVRFRVRHSAPEEVHVHGYDISRDLQPGRTVTMRFKAKLEGIFEIELEHSGKEIGRLTVEPK